LGGIIQYDLLVSTFVRGKTRGRYISFVAYSLLTTLKHSATPTNGPKIDAQVYS